ncbi:MAG: ABC transporter permease, partial [Gammaproteobacteria bacterium]|nr:ABC transporter permease [Gammaproteobacteria bacterium]
MSALRQIAAVSWMNLQMLPQRLGMSLVIVFGIAGVVGVLIAVLALASGLAQTLANTGRPDRAIVLSSSATSEMTSSLARDQALTIADAPGIRRNADGKPIVSADVLTIVKLKRSDDAVSVNVILRGIGPQGLALRPEVRIIDGRAVQPAVRELIVGRAAQAQFRGLELGNVLHFRNSDWTVVGSFDSGNSLESGLLADAQTVLSAYSQNAFQSLTAQIESEQGFDQLKDALTTNPTLSVKIERESDYYAAQTKGRSNGLFRIGYIVGTIMAIGALFGALNAMYSAVSARSLEIATLRALGFGAGAVVISVLIEALLLALAGGILGAGCAWLLFNGHAINTSFGSNTQSVFSSTVTPGLLAL